LLKFFNFRSGEEEMNAPPDTQAPPRRIGRSILAVLAGIVAGIVLSIATDLGLHAIGFVPSPKERWPNQLLVLATAYRSIYGIFASYVIARLAPNRPMGHSLLAGTLGLVVSSLGAAAAWSTTVGQHWYPVGLALTALPTAWIGAKLWLMQSHSQPTAASRKRA
jgi:hypothetical protein